ncbi:hypothetical protein KP79_PYT03292 [Mizuhopecten yessoensis]|uniref:Uncharacterized protein n=1 Tax=Mizuhopecten yessoensis TaxID=6573 RepID=A0A210PHI8_MIZYE|nr:hypothetical protein KP79_PYT03292 [Mizuhopecten yessoensis]
MKSLVMRRRRTIKERSSVKMQDDITKDNLELIRKLNEHSGVEYGWYYNCAIYGKCKATEMRVRFDLYDGISEVIRKHIKDVNNKNKNSR